MAITVTIAVDPETKEITVADEALLAIRETADITITGAGSHTVGNLALQLLRNGTSCAETTTFVDAGGGSYTCTLDMNTTEAIAVFEGARAQSQRSFDFIFYDSNSSNPDLIANDKISVQNMPITDAMPSPSAVGQTYMSVAPAGGNWKVIGGNICLWDVAINMWRPVFVNNGQTWYGPPIADS